MVNLVASYIFYAWWDWRFLILVALLTSIGFCAGLWMESLLESKQRKLPLWLGIVGCLLILGVFKYYNFFIESFCQLLGQSSENLTITVVLPIGISFYTFQTISYLVDLNRKQIPVERSLLRYATFLAFFPHVVAGPIVRAADFLPQLHSDPALDWNRVRSGFRLIVLGLVLKCVIADSLATVVDPCFARPTLQKPASVTIAVVYYAFQIYCDFSGYSLIAIGLARVLGYTFLDNFNRPYFSSSFSEFWGRWHISLSSWLRDYLYIPLGGNRNGTLQTYRNLFLTMLLGGLWHGASWTFVVWGALHGVYLIVQRITTSRIVRSSLGTVPRSAFRPASMLCTFMLTCVAWVFFRSSSVDVALQLLSKMTMISSYSLSEVGGKFYVVKGAMLVTFLVFFEAISFRVDFEKLLNASPVLDIVVFSTGLIALALLGTFENSSFIYFQF